MGIRDRMFELTAVEEVNEFLAQYPTSAFFKAGSCHKTMQGFGHVEQALDKRENIHLAFVRVVESRPVSNYIAEITKVIHQSPQLILMIDKKPVFDIDNWNITPEALEHAFHTLLGPVSEPAKHKCCGSTSGCSTKKANNNQDVEGYINLLQKFVNNELSENEFERKWLSAFQQDATPRSSQQFNLLNSLYGDVDLAISSNFSKLSIAKQSATDLNLKDKAKKLLEALI